MDFNMVHLEHNVQYTVDHDLRKEDKRHETE